MTMKMKGPRGPAYQAMLIAPDKRHELKAEQPDKRRVKGCA